MKRENVAISILAGPQLTPGAYSGRIVTESATTAEGLN